MGSNNDLLKKKASFFADSSEYRTNNTIAMLLYAYPNGRVMSTADMKKTNSFLPGESPILFSKASLEKL